MRARVALPVLWIAILALHLGRPYLLGMMSKFTLRLGADLLYMVYAGARGRWSHAPQLV